MSRARAAVISLAITACGGGGGPTGSAGPVVGPPAPIAAEPSPPSVPAPVHGAPIAKVTLADVGLEALSLDRTADPCVDFFQFACGGWLADNPIPADQPRWSRRDEVGARTTRALAVALDELAHGAAHEPASRQLADFYAACLDDAAIERAGLAPLRGLLARTTRVGDAAAWLAAVIELHKLGIFVIWDHRAVPDRKRATTYVTALDAAGLSLPDRDDYVNPAFKDKLDGLTHHAQRVLALVTAAAPAGALGPGKLDAGDVVAIESELARLAKPALARSDLAAAYNPIDRAELARQVRTVDWPAYFRGLAVTPSARIVIGTPALFAALDRVRARFSPAQWASYFTFHLVDAMAFALARPFDDEAFELDKLVTGVAAPHSRAVRCVDHTARALPDVLGQAYVARYVPVGARPRARELVDAVATAMGEEIASLPWLADATRPVAIAKLDKMSRMIGYPDHWQSYDFAIKRDDFAGDALRAAAFATHRALARAGKSVARDAWQLASFTVDAAYDPAVNAATVPAGLLQPPFFGLDRTIPVNLGGLGAAIGHELTHGFDDRGAELDADGAAADWWQADDRAAFAGKAACVAEQYATFEALPGKYVAGPLTLGENIADLGGVKMAYRAYRALRKDAVKTYVADGFTEDQQFFLAFGQAWCGRERAVETERGLTVGPHAPLAFRVYGALRNLPELADAFRCAPGTPMRPANTCAVW
jgi:putative endopeptidase